MKIQQVLELTAGALQSEKGYQLIGKTTYGKGSAQTQKRFLMDQF